MIPVVILIVAASAAPAAVGTSTAGASASALAHGTRFIDYQRPTQKILAIAILHCAVRLFVVTKFRKSETARVAGELIPNNLHGIGVKTGPREPILKLCFTGLVGKVAYKQFFQGDSFGPIIGRSWIVGALQSGRQDSTRLPCIQSLEHKQAGVNGFARGPGYYGTTLVTSCPEQILSGKQKGCGPNLPDAWAKIGSDPCQNRTARSEIGHHGPGSRSIRTFCGAHVVENRAFSELTVWKLNCTFGRFRQPRG